MSVKYDLNGIDGRDSSICPSAYKEEPGDQYRKSVAEGKNFPAFERGGDPKSLQNDPGKGKG